MMVSKVCFVRVALPRLNLAQLRIAFLLGSHSSLIPTLFPHFIVTPHASYCQAALDFFSRHDRARLYQGYNIL